jgi:hypothetical protein
LLIGTADPHPRPFASIEMIAEQHMPLDPDQCHSLRTFPAILEPCAKMILSSIPFHISQAKIPLPICSFALGPEPNEHAELQTLYINTR